MATYDNAVEKPLKKLGFQSLKPLQKQILQCIMDRNKGMPHKIHWLITLNITILI